MFREAVVAVASAEETVAGSSSVVAVAAEEEGVAGSSSVAPAGTDQLDMEAAEQLIQLSGGDGGGGSDSRSADSVKCRGKDKEEEEEAAAVESRRRGAGAGGLAAAAGKDGDGGEPGCKGAESVTSSTAPAAGVVGEKDKAVVVECRRRSSAPAGKDRDGGVVHGEGRRRPKYRSLADIYRETETRRTTVAGGGGEGPRADRDPSDGERRKKKRAAG